jgi:hypothetical protein
VAPALADAVGVSDARAERSSDARARAPDETVPWSELLRVQGVWLAICSLLQGGLLAWGVGSALEPFARGVFAPSVAAISLVRAGAARAALLAACLGFVTIAHRRVLDTPGEFRSLATRSFGVVPLASVLGALVALLTMLIVFVLRFGLAARDFSRDISANVHGLDIGFGFGLACLQALLFWPFAAYGLAALERKVHALWLKLVVTWLLAGVLTWLTSAAGEAFALWI